MSKQARDGFLKACICDLVFVPGLAVIYSQRFTQVITVMLMMENRDVPLTLQLGAFVSGPPPNGSKERVVMRQVKHMMEFLL